MENSQPDLNAKTFSLQFKGLSSDDAQLFFVFFSPHPSLLELSIGLVTQPATLCKDLLTLVAQHVSPLPDLMGDADAFLKSRFPMTQMN